MLIIKRENGWETPKIVETKFTSFSQIEEHFVQQDPFVCKGFVLVDAQFRKLSINAPRYIAVSCSIGFQVEK